MDRYRRLVESSPDGILIVEDEQRRGDSVLLIIEDDGVGVDPAARVRRGQGFGLLGMQERAGLVGAMLEIESSAGKGTTVLVRMAAGTRAGRVPDHE
jgi:nitrate/nitrite-specific signal transduction histidine kinase